MPRKTDHIVVGPTPATSTCLHCGRTLKLTLPMDIAVWIAATKAFVKLHTACTPPQPKEAAHAP